VIRNATTTDLPLVRELFLEFERDVVDAPHRDDDSVEDLAAIEQALADDVVLLAEHDDVPVGLAVGVKTGERVGELFVLYVRPRARGAHVAADLVGEVATQLRARGVEVLEVGVLASNSDARAVYERWGFAPLQLTLSSPIEALERRLTRMTGPTFGSVHVQTDDVGAVERATLKVLPRLGRSAGTNVTGPRNGWVAVHDDLGDRDPKQLQRLARELSYALAGVVLAIGVQDGAVVRYTLYDRGGAVDEYASVPEYDGPLPPGDVVALGANPTVVARLTGADPAKVREIARTAVSPAELPPALELVEAIAEVLGVAEAGHGWISAVG
jgi:GNAT superfamily N-acetyltransferase